LRQSRLVLRVPAALRRHGARGLRAGRQPVRRGSARRPVSPELSDQCGAVRHVRPPLSGRGAPPVLSSVAAGSAAWADPAVLDQNRKSALSRYDRGAPSVTRCAGQFAIVAYSSSAAFSTLSRTSTRSLASYDAIRLTTV